MAERRNGDNICKMLGLSSLHLPSLVEFITSLNFIIAIRLISFLPTDTRSSLSAYFSVSQRTQHKALHFVTVKQQFIKWRKRSMGYFILTLYYYFFFQRGGWGRSRGGRREKIPTRVHDQHRARRRAPFHDPEITTWAKTKRWTLNRLSHSGSRNSILFLIIPHFHPSCC